VLTSLNETRYLLSAAKAPLEKQLNRGDWARITQGLYDGDLCLIEHVGSTKALVRVIPRLPHYIGEQAHLSATIDEEQEEQKSVPVEGVEVVPDQAVDPAVAKANKLKSIFTALKAFEKVARPVPRLFNEALVNDQIRRVKLPETGKRYYEWNGQTFKKGYLYLKAPLKLLTKRDLKLTYEEVV